MPYANNAVLALNRGILSELALARTDIARYRMAADKMTNWIARVLGSMILRPGMQWLGHPQSNARSRSLPFVFAADDQARVEVTPSTMVVWIDDALLVRGSVGSHVTNGGFVGSLTGWTVSDESGSTSTWLANGKVSQAGNVTSYAILDQEVTVAPGDSNHEHALRIVVTRGPFDLEIGSAQGLGDYFSSNALSTGTYLGTGTHSIAFTPTGNFWIRIRNSNQNASVVSSIQVEGPGILTLPLPYQDADLTKIRYAQSADVMYLACKGYPQQKIARWGVHSWSSEVMEALKGPFLPINITPITITPSGLSGDITLQSSANLFQKGHVGALFSLTSSGQTVTADLAAANTFTNPIRVTGIGSQRNFLEMITGSFSGTITLQLSVGEPGAWIDTNQSYTGDISKGFIDNLDNQVIYYRMGFKAGDYTSGTATVTLSFASGSITGVVRITEYTDPQNVNAAVLSFLDVNANQNELGGTAATSDWNEGAWSDFRGWPTAVRLHEGRLWWFGVSIFGSVSDDYENFDPNVVGDSGVIQQQIGEGPVDSIHWALSLQRLMLGTASAEFSVFSSALAEPVTPTDCNIRPSSTQGSAYVDALRMDKTGIYVDVSGCRLFSLDVDIYTYDYKSNELTLMVPDLNAAGIVQIIIQRKPDTRIHCLRADGTVGMMVLDPTENVVCWQELETNGVIEDMCVLPCVPGSGRTEDQVYYQVLRTIGGAPARSHEKWAQESQCTGLPEACHADAFFSYQGTQTTVIDVPSYLGNGTEVVVWGWNTVNPFKNTDGSERGLDFGPKTVANGQIVVSKAVTNATIGLGYTAEWESMKQAFAAAMGTALNQHKRASQLGLILKNTHSQGLQFGNSFDEMDDLAQADMDEIPGSGNPDVDQVFEDYDQEMGAFDDYWQTDTRVCLKAAAPRPCNVLAFTLGMSTSG